MGILRVCELLFLGNIRVGAGVGHGEDTGAGVLELEVLVGKLLAVDGLATGTLYGVSMSISRCD